MSKLAKSSGKIPNSHSFATLAVPSHPHDGDGGGDFGVMEEGSSPHHATAAAKKDGSKMVSLDDFDLIRVIGRGSYAKVCLSHCDFNLWLSHTVHFRC